MKALMLSLIAFYRKHLSREKAPCCRFTPTCSAYAYEAIERWGALTGGFLAFFRILRCNPLCKGGYDPVPLRKKENKR